MTEKSLDVILGKLPDNIRVVLERGRGLYEDKITELSLRSGRPVCLYEGAVVRYITEEGFLTDSPNIRGLLYCGAEDIGSTVLRLCDYSVYAYQGEINSGFITVDCGVRVGLCGSAVMRDGKLINIREISSLNFRVAREFTGCSSDLLSKIEPLRGALICGPPSSGKTTLIRDISRVLSYKYRVSVLDERGEISAPRRGINAFDMGMCDIYVGYPKSAAAASAVRSMAPDIIVCDELGDKADSDMLLYALRRGTAFIASVHASSMDELRSQPAFSDMIETSAFRYIVFMSGRDRPGRINKIYEMSDRRG